MKKTITISVIVLLALGAGFFLYRISPQNQTPVLAEQFDLSGVNKISEPRPVAAGDYILGNPEARNTAIIYEDLQCPACANFNSIAKQIPSALSDTKLVLRHFPLVEIHKNAASAAFAAEAAGAQGKFWEFVNSAYEKQGSWENLSDPIQEFVNIAQEIGVTDIEKFRRETAEKTYKPKVQQDLVESLSLSLRGTPSLYFNNRKLELGDIESLRKQAESLYVK